MGSRQPSTRTFVLIAAGIFLSSAWNPALAQDGFNVQNFHPQPARWVNYFSVASAQTMDAWQWELGSVNHYSTEPLLLYNSAGIRQASVISQQLVSNELGAIGIAGFLELGFDIPLILLQEGGGDALADAGLAMGEAGTGIGDIRIIPRATFFNTDTEDSPGGVALGMLVNTWLPTGDSQFFRGEGFRAEPRLTFEAITAGNIRFGLNLGYMVRESSQLGNLEVDDTLTYGFASRIPVTPGRFYLVPEIFGALPIAADSFDLEETPLEILLGVKVTPSGGMFLEAGGGVGILEGFGSPNFRGILAFGYNSWTPPEPICALGPEDLDGFQDDDGCLDADNDSDTFPDVDDPCPNDPEDFDDWEDEGCPDPDNDQDSFLDIDDPCPNDPEDFDDWEDEGCPDPDNDQDSFLDPDDACPNEPETFNDYEDDDGCPDTAVVVTCERLEIQQSVYFEFDSAIIQSRSYGLLDEVATTLQARPDLLFIRVEGHTDDVGTDAYNLTLSEERAQSVVDYLTGRTVSPHRLIAEGFGESQPIDDNETEQGRSQNRRVVFAIVEQEGCVD